MYCNNCGKEIDNEWKACPYCGARNENVLTESTPQPTPQMNYGQPTPQKPYGQPAYQPSYNQQGYSQPVDFNKDFINPAQPKAKKKSKLPIIITAVVLVVAIVLGVIFIPDLIKGKGEEDLGITGGAIVTDSTDPNAVWVIRKICKGDEEIVFDYDAFGNTATQTRVVGGTEVSKDAWTYNDENKPIFMVYYNNGKEHTRYMYEYDSKGYHRTTSSKTIVGDNPTETIHIYSYDSYGNLIKDVVSDKEYYTYEYDNQGRLVTENEYRNYSVSDESLWTTVTTNYFYDSEGKLVEKKSNNSVEKYSYDSSGKLTTHTEYFDNEETAHYTYEYDANGNCIRVYGDYYDKAYEIRIEYAAISGVSERRAEIEENNQKKFDEFVYFGGL